MKRYKTFKFFDKNLHILQKSSVRLSLGLKYGYRINNKKISCFQHESL